MKGKKIGALALVIMIAIVGSVLWWAFGSNTSEKSPNISASGFIEAKGIAIAPETGGRIVQIAAEEGDRIKAGATLVKLDDSLLKAQKQQAEASVRVAQAALQQATVSRDGAKKAWENALEVKSNPLELEAKITAAQGALDMAELNLKLVKDMQTEWEIAVAEIKRDTARKILDNLKAQNTLGLVGFYQMNEKIYPAEGELAAAELNLSYQKELANLWSVPSAELRRDNDRKILDSLLAIKNNPQEINAAVDQSYTAYQTATAATETAKAQLEQAGASLRVIETQLSKLTVASPVSGVVAAKHAEVGEIAQPGAPILTVISLEEVTLTAYVSESKIGLIKLGQKVAVSVDSYPEEAFYGEIVYISPQALFTPRNIQLKEEREKMVFSVKVKLANPEQKLKPGMPADALIMVGGSN